MVTPSLKILSEFLLILNMSLNDIPMYLSSIQRSIHKYLQLGVVYVCTYVHANHRIRLTGVNLKRLNKLYSNFENIYMKHRTMAFRISTKMAWIKETQRTMPQATPPKGTNSNQVDIPGACIPSTRSP